MHCRRWRAPAHGQLEGALNAEQNARIQMQWAELCVEAAVAQQPCPSKGHLSPPWLYKHLGAYPHVAGQGESAGTVEPVRSAVSADDLSSIGEAAIPDIIGAAASPTQIQGVERHRHRTS